MQCFYPAGTNGGVIKPQPRLKQYGKTFKLFKNICNASVTGLWDMWLTNVFHFISKAMHIRGRICTITRKNKKQVKPSYG